MPGRWAHPLFAALALAGGAIWAMVSVSETPCSTGQPCGADWLGLAQIGLLLLCLYWIWRQPVPALAGVVVLAAASLTALADPGTATGMGESGFVAAAGFAALTLTHRLGARRRQRALSEEAAGPQRHPLPESAGRFARGRVSLIMAGLLFTVSAYALWEAHGDIDAYEERADRSTRVSARVVQVDIGDEDTSPLVAVSDDNRRYTVETVFPEDYPVGTQVELVVDGDWIRLVSEPYDIFGWELVLLAGSVAGAGFLANGVNGRRRSRVLDRSPLPVLKVLLQEGEDGRTWVYGADDTEAARPLLSFHSLYASENDPEDLEEPEDTADSSAPDGADAEDDHVVAERLRREEEAIEAILKGCADESPLREALLYGPLYQGAEVAFLAPEQPLEPDGEVEVEVERSVTPVRPVGQGLLPSRLARSRDQVPGHGRDGNRRRRRPVAAIAAEMLPSAAPLTWSADGASRGLGLFLLLMQGGGAWAVLSDGLSWKSLLAVLVLPMLISSIATALNWRLTADRDGVWVAGPWRVRHIPWNSVTGARHSSDTIVISVSGDKDVRLTSVGFFWLQNKLGRTSAALKAAEEVQALLHHPELRPDQVAGPSEQGMPLGPVIVVIVAVWAAAVLLLL